MAKKGPRKKRAVRAGGRAGTTVRTKAIQNVAVIEPERILRAINNPTKDAAQRTGFAWIDTKEVRAPGSKANAFLHDADHPVATAAVDTFRNDDGNAVPWSQRNSVRQELAA